MELFKKFFLFLLTIIILINTCFAAKENDILFNIESLLSNEKKTFDFLRNPILNTQNDTTVKAWWRGLVVPHYIQEFVNLFNITRDNSNNALLRSLLDGVSRDCRGHVKEWMFRISNTNGDTNLLTDDKWALQMIDSWGKLPEGILSGNVHSFGDFYECIETKVTDLKLYSNHTNGMDLPRKFEGTFCTSYILDYNSAIAGFPELQGQRGKSMQAKDIEPRRVVSFQELMRLISLPSGVMIMPSVATCWPNTCSPQDVQRFLVNGLNVTYSRYEQYLNISAEALPWPVTVMCRDAKKPEADAAVIAVITLISVIIAVCLVAGVIDYWQQSQAQKRAVKPARPSLAYQYFMAFSLYTNMKKCLNTRTSGDNMGCLHGIRFFSTCWVLIGHTYTVFQVTPIWNWIDVKLLYQEWPLLAVINGTVSVDTFFVVSGMLATFGIMKALDKTKGKLNVLMFYVHRYLRLTPTYAILVGIGATLFSYAGNHPSWQRMENQENFCRKYWWTNLLYVNNIVHVGELCNGESWYLANDFQFYVLSPFIVYPMWRWKKFGLFCLSMWTLVSWIIPVVFIHITGSPAMLLISGDIVTNGQYYLEIYMRPWHRIQTYFVGVWLGWVFYKTKGKKLKLPYYVVTALWTISTVTALAGIYGPYKYFSPDEKMPKIDKMMYAAFGRTSWGVAIAIVVFCCVKGYGGVVNSFLSWKVFIPLGRMCFSVYLISMHLQYIFHLRFPNPVRYDSYIMVNLFFAHIVMSFLAGFASTILFESPFIVLQKLIFEGGRPPPKPAQATSTPPAKSSGDALEKKEDPPITSSSEDAKNK